MKKDNKNQAYNPYLPGYEYIPDGEPYVFEGRVYVYGSHDRFHAPIFCVNDYVCWSAPVEDLSDWRYEGVIYRKNQDPKNKLGFRLLFAPDVTKGQDGRYYLYYAFDAMGIMGVAVCDTPAGNYEFYGYVHHADGTIWGRKHGDAFPFDPGVLLDEDGRVYLYSGYFTRVPAFATGWKRLAYDGGYVVELEADMLTIRTPQKLLFPKKGEGSFRNHEFFEASSIRKYEGKYYFVYSSSCNHELCYAVSDHPTDGFQFGGVLVSNGDIGLPMEKTSISKNVMIRDESHTANYIGNNHGGMLCLDETYYIFYHRHTDRTSYSRQACAERLKRNPDGSFRQAEMTSCGLNGKPLQAIGTYESRIACFLQSKFGAGRIDILLSKFHYQKHPYLTQNKKDGDETARQYIANMRDGAVAGFRYFLLTEENVKSKHYEVERDGKLFASEQQQVIHDQIVQNRKKNQKQNKSQDQNISWNQNKSQEQEPKYTLQVQIAGNTDGKMIISTDEFSQQIITEVPVRIQSKEITICEAAIQLPRDKFALYFRYQGKGKLDFYQFTILSGDILQ